VIIKIFTISEEDRQRFEFVYAIKNVEYLGDTKYDQVVFRKRQAEAEKILPDIWNQSSHCIVCGSIWPEDTYHLFPALKKILEANQDWKIILVPHEPHEKYVKEIVSQFSRWGIKRFSDRKAINKERVLIVDEIGHLAGLYHYADIAYVGGSFKQGIHNTMEPAIYGIPVLYGPVHKNSFEAIQLSRQNGGVVVHNKKDIYDTLNDLILNGDKRNGLGEKALQFASANTGATEQLLEKWKTILADDQ
jgi:3-deoxy-D-manno-octulosonic-acid transferase